MTPLPETEKSVLGSVLRWPTLMAQCHLTADEFAAEQHRYIFKAIQAVEVVTVITVGEHLRSSGMLKACGGAGYLADLHEDTATSIGFEHHCELVAKEARFRRHVELCRRTVQEAESGVEDTDDFVFRSTQRITELATAGHGSEGMTPWADVVQEASQDITQRAKGEKVAGVRTGVGALDAQISCLGNGELIIIAARPGMGKTALMQQIMEHVGHPGWQNEHVGIFSLEMKPQEFAFRHASAELKRSLLNIQKGHPTPKLADLVCHTLDQSIGLKWWFHRKTTASMGEIRRKAQWLKAKHGLGLIVIDYLQLMDGNKNLGRVQAIGEITRAGKQLAMELNVPVVLLSQLSRANVKDSHRAPRISDLRDSGSIEQDANIIIFVHREDANARPPCDAQIIVAKDRADGAGVIEAHFDRRFV